jgi:hypothetical protein
MMLRFLVLIKVCYGSPHPLLLQYLNSSKIALLIVAIVLQKMRISWTLATQGVAAIATSDDENTKSRSTAASDTPPDLAAGQDPVTGETVDISQIIVMVTGETITVATIDGTTARERTVVTETETERGGETRRDTTTDKMTTDETTERADKQLSTATLVWETEAAVTARRGTEVMTVAVQTAEIVAVTETHRVISDPMRIVLILAHHAMMIGS